MECMNAPEKNINDIPPGVRGLYQKGLAAVAAGDLDHAMLVFNEMLDREPGFAGGREALRQVQFKKAGHKVNIFIKLLKEVSEGPALAAAEYSLRAHPLTAIHDAEQVLNHDPANLLAHRILARAALAAGLPHTALLSLEFLAQHSPENFLESLEMADSLGRTGEITEAIGICGRLLKESPRDKRVLQMLGDLSAQAKREGERLKRAAIKAQVDRPPKAIKTEINSAEKNQELIKRYEALLTYGPRNLKFLHTLGDLYVQKPDLARALDFYQRALVVAGGKNAEIENAIAAVNAKRSRTAGTTSSR